VTEAARPEIPYGAWPSPFSAALVVRGSVSLGEVAVGEQDVWWSELRPSEQGRVALVRRTPGGRIEDVLPDGFSARTRVHEYGGGAWCVHDDLVFFSNWDDQRLYRYDVTTAGPPTPLTAEPTRAAGDRYADGRVTPDHGWLLCVRERHGDEGEPRNEIVAVPTDGGDAPAVLVDGADFVAAPRVSPDGRFLAWIQWNHPDMPWDGTELWVAHIEHDGAQIGLTRRRLVAGGRDESVLQPAWSDEGVLHFVSDRTDWWNIYRLTDAGLPPADRPPADAVTSFEGEVGTPPWVFGQSRYALLDDSRVLCAVAGDGTDRLAVVADGSATMIDSPYTSVWSMQRFGRGAVMVAATPDHEPGVVMVDVDGSTPTATFVELSERRDLGLDESWVAKPHPVAFDTTDGARAYGLYYPPTNPDVAPPPGDRPPLVVAIHGGPTGAARPIFSPALQFWTSRGFAVVDVNYRGSTGYGRAFRRSLEGRWGEADVEDCVAAARHLVDEGLVDGDRLVIRGGSAGGFTALCALTFHDRFTAGASLYGIADLEALAADTHKFESRYTDSLVGPYPEARDRYVERSPIHHTDRLTVPIIVLQGSDDEVVPPAQAEALVAALDRREIPYAYLLFDGEQHGFRQADNIQRALEAELSFYAQVFAITGEDLPEPVPIANLSDRGGEDQH
jgi:dipeptidyl aminopeptidase/acylaminoacyl peptidase